MFKLVKNSILWSRSRRNDKLEPLEDSLKLPNPSILHNRVTLTSQITISRWNRFKKIPIDVTKILKFDLSLWAHQNVNLYLEALERGQIYEIILPSPSKSRISSFATSSTQSIFKQNPQNPRKVDFPFLGQLTTFLFRFMYWKHVMPKIVSVFCY